VNDTLTESAESDSAEDQSQVSCQLRIRRTTPRLPGLLRARESEGRQPPVGQRRGLRHQESDLIANADYYYYANNDATICLILTFVRLFNRTFRTLILSALLLILSCFTIVSFRFYDDACVQVQTINDGT